MVSVSGSLKVDVFFNVVVNYFHSQSVIAKMGHKRADAAGAHYAECFAEELGTKQELRFPLFISVRANVAVAFRHPPRRRHHKSKRVFGDGLRHNVGRIGDSYALGGRRFDIDIIIAHGVVGNDFKLVAGGTDDGLIKNFSEKRYDGIGILNIAHHLFSGRNFVFFVELDFIAAGAGQYVKAGLGNGTRKNNIWLHGALFSNNWLICGKVKRPFCAPIC